MYIFVKGAELDGQLIEVILLTYIHSLTSTSKCTHSTADLTPITYKQIGEGRLARAPAHRGTPSARRSPFARARPPAESPPWRSYHPVNHAS